MRLGWKKASLAGSARSFQRKGKTAQRRRWHLTQHGQPVVPHPLADRMRGANRNRIFLTMALRIGIAGAGVLGRLLAFTLSRAGHDVQVFDPASGPGPRTESGSQAAGWTAAGMLSPVAELERAGAEVFALGVRSCQLWPQIVQALSEPVALHMQGSLLLMEFADRAAAETFAQGDPYAKAGLFAEEMLADGRPADILDLNIRGLRRAGPARGIAARRQLLPRGRAAAA